MERFIGLVAAVTVGALCWSGPALAQTAPERPAPRCRRQNSSR
jgi:hypothetical protein